MNRIIAIITAMLTTLIVGNAATLSTNVTGVTGGSKKVNILPNRSVYISAIYITNNATGGTNWFVFYDAPSTNTNFNVPQYTITTPQAVTVTNVWTNVLNGVVQTNVINAIQNVSTTWGPTSAQYNMLFSVPVAGGSYILYQPNTVVSMGLLLNAPTNCGIQVIYSDIR